MQKIIIYLSLIAIIFSNVHYVQEGVIDTLQKKGINPTVVKGDKDPIYGAYYMAKRKGIL